MRGQCFGSRGEHKKKTRTKKRGSSWQRLENTRYEVAMANRERIEIESFIDCNGNTANEMSQNICAFNVNM